MRGDWSLIIKPKVGLFDFKFYELLQYRDLLWTLVKRDFVAFYKQTILGPFWFFIQPIFTVALYVFLFGSVANISTGDIPMPLFYLSGIMAWTYFSEIMMKTSNVFRDNAGIFSKVYFPRLIIPISIILSNGIKLFIHLILMVILIFYFNFSSDIKIIPSSSILFLPLLILLMALFGVGIGLIFSAVTTKYRDFSLFLSISTNLLMYTSPVVYPLSRLTPTIRELVNINPMTHLIEGLRYSFFNQGDIYSYGYIYAIVIIIITLLIGLIAFNKVEKNFIDTI
jgi:lipopolysaccharide transport system permease protein